MLAAAGIDTEGPLGALKLQGAVLVYREHHAHMAR